MTTRRTRPISWLVGLLILAIVVPTSCTPGATYEASVDIPSPWVSADALLLPLNIDDSETAALRTDCPYHLRAAVRHTSEFPYRDLAVGLALRYIDSRGVEYTVRQVPLTIPLTDADGLWDGGTWGDLIQKETDTGISLSFPYTGRYQFAITPPADADSISGLVSMTLRLMP